jgi:hypothetical protein
MKFIGGKRSSRARSKANSILQQVADAWNSIGDKSAWEAAAAVSEIDPYKLFTQDMSYRIKNGLEGIATPSLYHQYTVRKIEVFDNNTENLNCVFRRRHITNLPGRVNLSIKVNKTSAGGQVAVVLIAINNIRGLKIPTFYRLATISTTADWQNLNVYIYKFIKDQISNIGLAIGFENGWEGTILIDNVRFRDNITDKYTGWRQNPGTDDWQTITNGANIIQNLIYPE